MMAAWFQSSRWVCVFARQAQAIVRKRSRCTSCHGLAGVSGGDLGNQTVPALLEVYDVKPPRSPVGFMPINFNTPGLICTLAGPVFLDRKHYGF